MSKLEKGLISQQYYELCLEKMLEHFDKYFLNISRVCNNIKYGTYPFPTEQERVNINYNNLKMHLVKCPDDPFDVVYYLKFRMKQSKFSIPFERCLLLNNVRFKFEDYEYKTDVLIDFLHLVSKKYNLKIKFSIENPYIIYNIAVRKFIKTEVLVENLWV